MKLFAFSAQNISIDSESGVEQRAVNGQIRILTREHRIQLRVVVLA